MKNKIKYLLGLFVVGVGLLFNQSFALNYITVDGVIEGSLYSNTSRSSNYRYLFAFDSHTINGTATPYSRQFGFSVYYDGLTKYNYYPYQRQAGACPSSYSEFQIRTGRTSNNWYTGTCSRFSTNIYSFENMPQLAYNNNGSYDRNIRVLFGQDDLFGNAFVVVGVPDSSSNNISPVYSMGAGNLTYENYMPVNENYSDYYRFFYKNTGDISALKTSWSNSNLANLNYNSWEYFYPRGTRTNYGYIVDDGSLYTKYKHFGLFDMGYSYVYGKVSQSATSLSWSELGFNTVGDEVETFLKIYGDMSYNDFQQYSANGILLLRGNQYLSMGNDDGVYLLSKDGNNPSRVLYEHWSCNIDNVNLLFSGGYESSPCVKLDGGYLIYNGTTDVLPFTDFTTPVSINTLDSNHPLLYDLTNGGKGLTKVAGEVTRTDSSCIKINSNRCYGFISNTSVNIKESYLNGGIINPTSQVINEFLVSKCLSDSQFALQNYLMCNGVQHYYGGTYALGSGYYYQYSTDSSGNISIEIIDQAGLFENHTGYVWIQDSSGNWVTNCDGGRCNPNPTNVSGSQYLSGEILVEDYYDGTGLFFACPYPYDSVFTTNGWDLKLGKFDILGPINCFISAFKHGKSFNFLDSAGLYDFGPLIQGTTDNHKTLYMFFDFLLIMWFVVFFTFIYKRFK